MNIANIANIAIVVNMGADGDAAHPVVRTAAVPAAGQPAASPDDALRYVTFVRPVRPRINSRVFISDDVPEFKGVRLNMQA